MAHEGGFFYVMRVKFQFSNGKPSFLFCLSGFPSSSWLIKIYHVQNRINMYHLPQFSIDVIGKFID